MSKFAFLIITTILLQGCYEFTKPSNELKRILKEGKIVIASEYGANSYFLQNDMPSGFEYELAAGFAEFIGVELEIKPFYTNSLMLKQLQQQHIDIIASQFSFATDTLSQFKLGPAYQYYSQQVVIHRSERKLSDIKEMTGKVFVQRYSQQATIMQKHHQNTNINRLNWQQVEQYDDEELLLMVAEKKIDATIANSALVNVMRRRYPEIKMGCTTHLSAYFIVLIFWRYGVVLCLQ